ncbi:MAG: ATP-dependent sacrificial sulfur transferase LarE [Actinobacteria bacterium]|nr:ATP-dependent sacrificial sulfur transferase LarE [Actinomycetota bacterium]
MLRNKTAVGGRRSAVKEAKQSETRITNGYDRLLKILKKMGSALVAFSGGVDSALVARAVAEALKEKAVAVTAISATLSERERLFAKEVAKLIGIRHIEIEIDELSSAEFVANSPHRCYYCKRLRMARLQRYAVEAGFNFVVDGANIDDLEDWRPGLKANEELGVRSPLIEASIGKLEVRTLLDELGLPFWNRPSSPCLASRLPYGTTVTREKLAQIEAAEEAVRALGVADVRVRHHGDTARIEVPGSDFQKILAADQLSRCFKKIGFKYIALDLDGLRSGSLNEIIKPSK